MVSVIRLYTSAPESSVICSPYPDGVDETHSRFGMVHPWGCGDLLVDLLLVFPFFGAPVGLEELEDGPDVVVAKFVSERWHSRLGKVGSVSNDRAEDPVGVVPGMAG